MIRERTRAGLADARERGARVGRPAKLRRHQQQEVIRTVREGSKTAADAESCTQQPSQAFGIRPGPPALRSRPTRPDLRH
jgi:DNA invertase Pin-like site-specific DNA recombinase